jgi:hypothetical protein
MTSGRSCNIKRRRKARQHIFDDEEESLGAFSEGSELNVARDKFYPASELGLLSLEYKGEIGSKCDWADTSENKSVKMNRLAVIY